MVTQVNKRRRGRAKRELTVEIKTGTETKQVYTIDLSLGGMKVGGAVLQLQVGEPVEVIVKNAGVKLSFPGQVEREDGLCLLNRIGRNVSTYFIRIIDERFAQFVSSNYHI